MINSRNIKNAFLKGYRVDKTGNLISPKGVVRKLHKDRNGYLGTNIRIEGKLCHLYLHQLVAYQKYGNKIYSAECVRHLDGNTTNNAEDNIEIGTLKENSMDIPEVIRKRSAEHATSYVRKWNKKEVREYHEANGGSYKDTMEYFGITSKGTLWYLLKRSKGI